MNPMYFAKRFFSTSKNPKVFFDIAIDNTPKGRLVFELYSDVVPKTAENFRKLCIGAGDAKTANTKLHYKGSHFHRIIPGFMAQGGDFTRGNGTGGESIYGAKFPDENFKIKHDRPGLLSMANAGPNTNGSQFFITFVECPWLDGKHTVFGALVGSKQLLNELEYCGSQSGQPKKRVTITDCGEVKEETK
mmetsp:Transcript_19228/g.22064  ORF Transcript_19228/g.22064 Transcript_19228/m.22064 type:complete len:190 (-) Transcript_19228:135-704(-)